MDVEGMVAMVRALPDATLAMSLLDGTRQYTLVPASQSRNSASAYVQAGASTLHSVATEPCVETKIMNGHHAHSAVQAVDGRYASVYQMSHCSVQPTSPPVQLTEFPPQRTEPCRGQGNFVVGGLGSGENGYNSPMKICQAYRGAMNWPDRSVYSPRQVHHYEPDPFAHSLRKYPNLSPERSAEVIQRLINYTTMKNSCAMNKNAKSGVSPTRADAAPPGLERRPCVAATLRARIFDTDSFTKSKSESRCESPTRDSSRLSKPDCDGVDMKRSMFGRNYDVRYVRDLTRRAKETFRNNVTTYPYNHPVCPPIKERYDHLPPRNVLPIITTSHMETQAEIPMVSREVTTVPREKPSTRNIAVPLSPSSSYFETSKPLDCTENPPETTLHSVLSHKYIQTASITDLTLMKPRKSVQTCISSIDIHETNNKIVKNCRKTKSQEEIRSNYDMDDELIKVIRELSYNYNNDNSYNIRNGLLKRLKKIYKTDRNDKLKAKLGRCVRDQLYANADYKKFTRELSNELISKIKASNMILKCCDPTNVIRADVTLVPYRTNSGDKCVNGLIKEWLDKIPVKSEDYLGRPVKKELVLQAVTSKIKYLIINKVHQDIYTSLKPELLDILDDIPIDVNARNKTAYLNRITHDLIKKIGDIFTVNAAERTRWQKAIDLDKRLRNNLKKDSFVKYNLPTDNELRRFVNQELKDFTTKFNVKICPNTEKEIQIELVDILIDSFNDFRYGEEEKIKEEILITLSEFINISEHEGIYFVNNLIYNFKDLLKEIHTENLTPQTFVVLRNAVQNSTNQTLDFTIQGITDEDINSNLDAYTQHIVQQVNEWMANIKGLNGIDASFKRVVAHDLAGDIVDRHKYLELNPSSRGTDADELEHLKYQIFKWVNKLVGEENLETIEHASQLMRMIQNIPVPMLTRPALNINTSMPACCRKGTESNRKSRSGQRRFSCPDDNVSEKPRIELDQRRQSSPGDILYKKNVSTENVTTKSLGVMVCPSQTGIEQNSSQIDQMHRRTACTETGLNHIPQTHPRSTSMTNLECPRAARQRDQSRRDSSPPGLFSGYENRPGEEMLASARNIGEQTKPRIHDRPPPLCCDLEIVNPATTIKLLNDEYDKYLQNWVSQIPIITSKPEEQALIGLMRKGIYNGVWKALTKLQMNPTTLSNRFHYQDVLDDELEELLDLLPESNELTKKKQMMKNQLIERTVNMNDQIYHISPAASYKQQLVDNVATHMPRKAVGFTGSDIDKICEDIHKLNLAETFIIYTMYNRHNDAVKANVYKKKLLKQIQEFLDEYKKSHGTDAMAIDFATYKDEILNDLYKVPSPSDETIREEADEVMIGLEIEQWFQDLPLYPTENNFEMLCRKRYRDTLAQKVHEMEKKKNLADCEDELRHEITRFMTKLPIREGEIENTSFMIEELVNRLKNRPKDLVVGTANRFVNFIDPYDYDEFSRNMPHCSSFSQAPGARKAQINESSYMVRDGERVEDAGGRFQYVGTRDSTSATPQQWYSLQEDGGHKQLAQEQIAQGPDCCQPNLFDGSGAVASQPQLPRDFSYKRPDTIREASMMRETSPHSSRLQETQMSAPCCLDQGSPDHRSLAPSERIPGSPRNQELNAGRQRSPDRRLSPAAERFHYMPRIPEAPSICPSQRFRGQGLEPTGYPGNMPSIGLQGNVSTGFPPPECCLKPNGNLGTSRAIPGRSTDTYEADPSTKPYETAPAVCPGASAHFNERTTPNLRKPVGQSTPLDNFSVPRESRSKKRIKEDRTKREGKKYVTDSDDSVRAEVRCRCMERIWRCRKKKIYPPCDECDIGFPPCYPMRFAPFPYYF